METENFHNDRFYDAYVLGRLSSQEEDLFEEHILFCEDCRKEIELREVIVSGGSRQNEILEHQSYGGRPAGSRILVRIAIAASVIIAAGYSLYLIFSSARESSLVEREDPVVETQDDAGKSENADEVFDTAESLEGTSKSEELLAANYVPSAIFENAIRNQVRSSGIRLSSPDSTQTFKTDESIVFRWESGVEQLTLVIFNNKGNVLLEERVKSPFILHDTLLPGLYYWQLETKEEALLTSRFFVNRTEKPR